MFNRNTNRFLYLLKNIILEVNVHFHYYFSFSKRLKMFLKSPKQYFLKYYKFHFHYPKLFWSTWRYVFLLQSYFFDIWKSVKNCTDKWCTVNATELMLHNVLLHHSSTNHQKIKLWQKQLSSGSLCLIIEAIWTLACTFQVYCSCL